MTLYIIVYAQFDHVMHRLLTLVCPIATAIARVNLPMPMLTHLPSSFKRLLKPKML